MEARAAAFPSLAVLEGVRCPARGQPCVGVWNAYRYAPGPQLVAPRGDVRALEPVADDDVLGVLRAVRPGARAVTAAMPLAGFDPGLQLRDVARQGVAQDVAVA